MWQVPRPAQTRVIRRPTDGVNRIMLEEPKLIWSIRIGSLFPDEFLLQSEGFSEAHSPQPPDDRLVFHIRTPLVRPSFAASCARR
jgi:hypothetical protein